MPYIRITIKANGPSCSSERRMLTGFKRSWRSWTEYTRRRRRLFLSRSIDTPGRESMVEIETLRRSSEKTDERLKNATK